MCRRIHFITADRFYRTSICSQKTLDATVTVSGQTDARAARALGATGCGSVGEEVGDALRRDEARRRRRARRFVFERRRRPTRVTNGRPQRDDVWCRSRGGVGRGWRSRIRRRVSVESDARGFETRRRRIFRGIAPPRVLFSRRGPERSGRERRRRFIFRLRKRVSTDRRTARGSPPHVRAGLLGDDDFSDDDVED